MRRLFSSAFLATVLCGAVACAPRNTTVPAHSESERNIVTAADIEQFPDMPLEMVIQRKIPGISLHNSNGVLVIQIRGQSAVGVGPESSRTSNLTPPLYVVNGLRTPSGGSGEMPSIPARDIARIKVLKGSDAGLYGLDGANGVIEITTKSYSK